MASRRPLGPLRLVLFSLATLAGAVIATEGLARLLEDDTIASGVEAWSPMAFQQLPPAPWMLPAEAPDRLRFAERLVDHDYQSIPVQPEDDELRVVLLGGSALAGLGLEPTVGPAAVLERLLAQASPSRRVRVISLARSGYGSAQLARVFEELAPQLQPDLVVTVMGNNERHDLVNSVVLAGGRLRSVLASRWMLRHSAVFRWLSRPEPVSLDDPAPQMATLEQVDHAGLESTLLARLDRNLERIAAAAEREGAALMVSTVAVNLRYSHTGHEWAWFGDKFFTLEEYRVAHWARYHEAPDAGLQAMEQRLAEFPDDRAALLLAAEFLEQLDRPDEAAVLVERVQGSFPSKALGDLPANQMLLAVWAQEAGPRPQSARAAVELWRSEHPEPESLPGRTDSCALADLLWLSDSKEEAAQAYDSCLLSAFLYRADSRLNEQLRTTAARLGVESVDLDREIRAAVEGSVPGYSLFLDYCHFNARGAILAGHLLAGPVARTLGLPGPVPPADQALERYRSERAGRGVDLPALADWAGAGFDVTLLTSRRLPPVGAAPAPDQPSPRLEHLFRGHQLAQRAGPAEPHRAQEARAEYERVLELHPGDPSALESLRLLEELLLRR